MSSSRKDLFGELDPSPRLLMGPGPVDVYPRVLRAMSTAREAGAGVIGITGRDGGDMSGLADVCIIVPADNMQQIEDAHLAIAHAIYVELRARAEGAAAG